MQKVHETEDNSLNTQNILLTQINVIVEPSSLELFQSHQDMVVGNLLEQGVWTRYL